MDDIESHQNECIIIISLSHYEHCINLADSEGKASARKATGGGSSLNGGLDYRDGDQDAIGLPPPDEDEDDDELNDAPPVYSKYFQPFMHSCIPSSANIPWDSPY
ncbi:hypothetical protein PISMIDRAFT_13940 [Pisolithus microcarpus 441]|uniref:Uncharacterized protein n=1 Tax=Pisolithus microcarpus 441 TaxID=765257 RepID=A0A0C9Z9C9_9AGAM|nr:hypothetical protein BKA83DRAFT_13940 [Pisolithus microcarpus]KIK19042.1 hypothetical protein PISMIDRAFT_13940 [Pisolithus microcarpus 441]